MLPFVVPNVPFEREKLVETVLPQALESHYRVEHACGRVGDGGNDVVGVGSATRWRHLITSLTPFMNHLGVALLPCRYDKPFEETYNAYTYIHLQ